MCECDCWLHDLLYGDSPYNNLTYEEIEQALENVTKKVTTYHLYTYIYRIYIYTRDCM